jgi:8-oxo-dGTP diphosphatase
MQTRNGRPRELMRDIKAVEWLSLGDAIALLTHPMEQSFLGEIGRRALRAAVAPRRQAPQYQPAQAARSAKTAAPPHRPPPAKAGAEFVAAVLARITNAACQVTEI